MQETESVTEAVSQVDVSSSIDVQSPTSVVFDFWRKLENFPSFMAHVKEVRAVSDNRYFWRVQGLAGTEMSWEADVTEVVKNQLISWESVEGSTLDNAGSVRFEALSEETTRINVSLRYAPPAGILGHAIATLLSANPAQQMDEDLQRYKAMIESGADASPSMQAAEETAIKTSKASHAQNATSAL